LTPRSAAEKSAHTVQVAQEQGAEIDGRSVVISLDEMHVPEATSNGNGADAAAAADGDDASAAATEASEPALLHAFLFRTFEPSTNVHQHVIVPFAVVSTLPECVDNEGFLLRAEQRPLLAEALFARLRFIPDPDSNAAADGTDDAVGHKLAFNPSHALGKAAAARGKSATRGTGKPGKKLNVAASTSSLKRKPAASSPAKKRAPTSSSAAGGLETPLASAWDSIGPDGKMAPREPTADEVEWDRAIHGDRPLSSASGSAAESRLSSPLVAKGARRAGASGGPRGTHHLSTTLATVLRAGQGAPDAVHVIEQARANRERQRTFRSHVVPIAPVDQERSRSPLRHTAGNSVLAEASMKPSSKGSSSPARTASADAKLAVSKAKRRAAAQAAAEAAAQAAAEAEAEASSSSGAAAADEPAPAAEAAAAGDAAPEPEQKEQS